MSNCSGCGGRGHSPGGEYGHILGCGTPDEGIGITPTGVVHPKYAHFWNETKKAEQLGIIKEALLDSTLDPKFEKTAAAKAFAKELNNSTFANTFLDTFALNLGEVLRDHSLKCDHQAPGTCKHVVQQKTAGP